MQVKSPLSSLVLLSQPENIEGGKESSRLHMLFMQKKVCLTVSCQIFLVVLLSPSLAVLCKDNCKDATVCSVCLAVRILASTSCNFWRPSVDLHLSLARWSAYVWQLGQKGDPGCWCLCRQWASVMHFGITSIRRRGGRGGERSEKGRRFESLKQVLPKQKCCCPDAWPWPASPLSWVFKDNFSRPSDLRRHENRFPRCRQP